MFFKQNVQDMKKKINQETGFENIYIYQQGPYRIRESMRL